MPPSEIPVIVTGGVTPENIAGYLAAGAMEAGTGSSIYRLGDNLTVPYDIPAG